MPVPRSASDMETCNAHDFILSASALSSPTLDLSRKGIVELPESIPGCSRLEVRMPGGLETCKERTPNFGHGSEFQTLVIVFLQTNGLQLHGLANKPAQVSGI